MDVKLELEQNEQRLNSKHNYAKLALEEAFTPELRKMLEEKQGKENEA